MSCSDFKGILEQVVTKSAGKGSSTNNKRSLKEIKARKTS